MPATTPASDRPADLLRAAAEKLRAVSSTAADGPWTIANIPPFTDPVLMSRYEETPADGEVLIVGNVDVSDEDQAHIALMHPGVGLALADWLEREGLIWQAIDDASAAQEETGVKVTVGLSTHAEALAVARQLLGTTTTEGCPSPAAAPLAGVWTVWAEDESTLGHYTDEVTAKLAAIEYHQETETPGLKFVYRWNKHGGRLELLADGSDTGLRVKRDPVYGAPPAPADRAAVLNEAADVAESLRQFDPAYGARKDAQVSENVGVLRVADHLRRLAGEAAAGVQQTTTSEADTVLAAAIPSWEAVYEPGNVSDYLIGYANSEAAAKGAAVAWVLSESDKDAARLEWTATPHGDDYDEYFELSERHDDGIDTTAGVTVRHRVLPYTAADFTPEDDEQPAAPAAPEEPTPAPQCSAGLLPATDAAVDRCVRHGAHDTHVTAAGARWPNEDPEL